MTQRIEKKYNLPEEFRLKRSSPKAKQKSPGGTRGQSRIDFILDIAAKSFLEKGFEATTISEIARIAHASKETIYGKYVDKSALFRAVMQRSMDRFSDQLTPALVAQSPPTEALTAFGELLLDQFQAESGIRFQKIVATESQRFPEISRLLYELGPRRTIAALTVYFDAQVERGTLRKMDARIAAEHFVGILTSELSVRRALGLVNALTPEEKSERLRITLDVFLRAYGAAQ